VDYSYALGVLWREAGLVDARKVSVLGVSFNKIVEGKRTANSWTCMSTRRAIFLKHTGSPCCLGSFPKPRKMQTPLPQHWGALPWSKPKLMMVAEAKAAV